MSHIRRRDRVDEDEAVQIIDVVEQALATAEQSRHQVKLSPEDDTVENAPGDHDRTRFDVKVGAAR